MNPFPIELSHSTDSMFLLRHIHVLELIMVLYPHEHNPHSLAA